MPQTINNCVRTKGMNTSLFSYSPSTCQKKGAGGARAAWRIRIQTSSLTLGFMLEPHFRCFCWIDKFARGGGGYFKEPVCSYEAKTIKLDGFIWGLWKHKRLNRVMANHKQMGVAAATSSSAASSATLLVPMDGSPPKVA